MGGCYCRRYYCRVLGVDIQSYELIHYSLDDASIREFVSKLNCIEGVRIEMTGDIKELKHQDYHEFVATVPAPLFLVTTYKSNGMPNACMQSWATFTSADHGNGFYAILASVNKNLFWLKKIIAEWIFLKHCRAYDIVYLLYSFLDGGYKWF